MNRPKVAIVMGSDSDLEIMEICLDTLKAFEISYAVRVLSAHRTPELVMQFAASAKTKGFGVIIAAAGGAAHLAGVIAAHTVLPVIGVPVPSTALSGLDSLLSIVQMPAGVPVATVAIGKPGARNAAILAAQILGVSDADLRQKLVKFKEDLAEQVCSKDKKLQERMSQ